jgi:hypothetical protein
MTRPRGHRAGAAANAAKTRGRRLARRVYCAAVMKTYLMAFGLWVATMACGGGMQPCPQERAVSQAECVGLVHTCSGLNTTDCAYQDGCEFDGWGDCSGTATRCSELRSETYCNFQVGCTWKKPDDSNPTPSPSSPSPSCNPMPSDPAPGGSGAPTGGGDGTPTGGGSGTPPGSDTPPSSDTPPGPGAPPA